MFLLCACLYENSTERYLLENITDGKVITFKTYKYLMYFKILMYGKTFTYIVKT